MAPALSFWASSRRGDASGDSDECDIESDLRVGGGAGGLAFTAVPGYRAWLPISIAMTAVT